MKKWLHISYYAQNTWEYPIQSAINNAIANKYIEPLPEKLKNRPGDLVLAVSVRLDYLPHVIQRISSNAPNLFNAVKSRDKTKDGYAYQLQ